MNRPLMLMMVACGMCGVAAAQNTAPALPPPPPMGGNVMFYRSTAGAPGEMGEGKVGMFSISLQGNGKTVTNAPYSATAVTETTQVLSDGNRISNKVSASLARDSQGRTRREEAMGALGPWQVNGPKLIFVTDPTSQTNLVIDPDKQLATVLQSPKAMTMAMPMPAPEGAVRVGVQRAAGPQTEQVKTDELGVQIMEGVSAEGKRVTRTIPAGEIGNSNAIEITSEVWTSPDLQVTVMSKHNDPRFGETVYRLTNINRVEPDHSLFEVPPGYAVKNMPGPPQMPGMPAVGAGVQQFTVQPPPGQQP